LNQRGPKGDTPARSAAIRAAALSNALKAQPFALLAGTAATACTLALYARAESPWFVLGWVGLIPWLAGLDRVASWRGALAAGVLFSEAFVLAVFGWLPTAIESYTGAPRSVAVLVVLLTAPILQPQFVTFALARHLARARERTGLWRSALVGGGVYVGTEWLWPKLFADTLGHGLYPSVLMRQAADIAGAHGLTFVLIVANECGLAALRALATRRTPCGDATGRRAALVPVATVIALALVLLIYGAARLGQLRAAGYSEHSITAALVQADIRYYGQLAEQLGTFDAVRVILDAHFSLSTEALERAKIDLLIWPETVYPTTFGSPKSADGAAFDREIGAFVNAARVPLIFGAYDAEDAHEFNAAVFLEPAADGRLAFDTYRKASLFPLTERVPAVLESEQVRRWLPWLGTWQPGSGPQVRSITLADGRTMKVAPLICYDALAPGNALAAVRQGAEVIVTLSNDSWFSYANVPHLILALSAFRSIETRRPQLRATNTGISAVIDATGELTGSIGVDQRGELVRSVAPERRATSLMLEWGDWFAPSALGGGLALLLAPLLRRPARSRRR
jgi:apolipoprotein N-acyltransferase